MPDVDWGKDVGTAIDAILTHFEKKQAKKKTAKIIGEAEAKGQQVEYKVDPSTGVITPTIKSKQADPYAGMIQEALKTGQFEMGGLTKTGPTFKKVETLKIDEGDKAQALAIIDNRQKIIDGGGQFDIKMPTLGGSKFEMDLKDRGSIETGLSLQFGSLWKEDPDIKASLDRSFVEKPKVEDKVEKKVKGLREKITEKFAPKYKAGESRVINGVTYIRDEQGKWLPTQQAK